MMRTALLVWMALVMAVGGFAQSKHKVVPYRSIYDVPNQSISRKLDRSTQTYVSKPGGDGIPLGSSTTHDVTVTKIAEASNAYSTLAPECHPLAVLNGLGDGGTIAFVHRHNVQKCFPGEPADNGRLRYTISTDGGQSWNVGDGITVSAENPAPPNQCLGIGLLTPNYTYRSRYPMTALFAPDGNELADIKLAVASSTLSNGEDGWNGAGLITVDGAATDDFEVSETYPFVAEGQWINASLVERVPGEFWYVTLEDLTETNTGKIFVYKGVYNSASGEIDWERTATLQPNHALIDVNNTGSVDPIIAGLPNIAFSPDGQTGYISFLGDLVGGQDTVVSPVFIESTDGGASWETPYEFDMGEFQELRDSLQFFVTLDTVGTDNMGNPIVDTIPIATGKATTGFDHDLVVDAEGNPHLLAVVGPASTQAVPEAGYSIFSGLYLMLYDFTRDEFGDWNMLHVSSVNTFRSTFPLSETITGNIITQDNHMQLARSDDGTKIFMAYLDTDTTNPAYQPIVSPNDTIGTITNIAPNLLTRAYDLNTGLLTPLENQTITDPTWGGGILLPKVSPTALNTDGSTVYTLPTVFSNIDGATALLPTSYYYISDITFDAATDFTEPANFFFNCKTSPFANVVEKTDPACGQTSGEIGITVNGGTGPFRYEWTTIEGAADLSEEEGGSVSDLSAGIYQVTVTDENGCTDVQTVNLNNQDAPAISVDAVTDISCFGAGDGGASISVNGGTGELSYAWSNGEEVANPISLPAGSSTLKVTDEAGCESFVSVSIDEPSEILVDLTVSDVTCNGFADGLALARTSGGTPPFSFAWSTGAETESIEGLNGGEYSVVITDDNECEEERSFTINEPSALEASFQVVSANTREEAPFNGRAFVSGGGGVPFTGGALPYEYTWCDGFEGNFNIALPGGPCPVTITDANGCTLTDTVLVEGTIPTNLSRPEVGINLLQVFPNPNQGQFEVAIDLTRVQNLEVQLLNMQGQVLDVRHQDGVRQYQTTYDLRQFARGIYMIRVQTSQGISTQRVFVVP